MFFNLIEIAVECKEVFESEKLDGAIFKTLMLYVIKVMTDDNVHPCFDEKKRLIQNVAEKQLMTLKQIMSSETGL